MRSLLWMFKCPAHLELLLGWPKSLLRFFPSDVTVRSSNTMEEWLWRTTHGLCNILLYPFQQQCFAWPYALLNRKRQGNVPGGPVVESLPSNAGSITGRDPTCLMAKKQKHKKIEVMLQKIKGFKNGSHKKILKKKRNSDTKYGKEAGGRGHPGRTVCSIPMEH